MRKVTFGGASSLDNFFARKDGGMDWLMWSDEAMELAKDMWPKIDTFIMGRKTYEVAMAGQGEVDEENVDSDIKTFIFSRTLPAGKTKSGAEVVASDPGEFVRELKLRDGKDICIMGGGDLACTLFEAGVIDEIGFNIHPVLLGSGIPLFYEISRQIDLDLIECKALKNGCVYVLYRVKN